MFSKKDVFLFYTFSLFYLFNANLTSAKLDIVRQFKVLNGYPLDSQLNFTELATEYGYTAEEHTVTTEDGYILTIFRITHGRNCQGPLRKPPVLLMHGLFMSSDLWMDSGPGAGLAYLISDECYDLWVGNVRGNYYGKRHTYLNPNSIEFWNFTIDEMGRHDVPAMIDYITNYTSSDTINYVGYSQGSSIYFIMCSEQQSYCGRVQVVIFLAPGSRLTYTKSIPFRLLTSIYQVGASFLIEVGIYEAIPWGGIIQQLGSFICKDNVTADTTCRDFLSKFDSPHPDSIETETIRVLFGHFPAGTSVKNMLWYNQAQNVDDFQKFDYGSDINEEVYNSSTPPAYNLSATTNPTVVISGRNDFLSVPPDNEWLVNQLPNVIEHVVVEDPLWNHFDVPWSKLTSKDIFPKITDYLYRYSKVGRGN